MSSKFGDQSPNAGRFQARHVFRAALNLKASTGNQIFMPVVHDKIELIEFGWEIDAAVGTVTTAGKLQLDKIPAGNGAQVPVTGTASSSALTYVVAGGIYSIQSKDLNLGVGGTPLDGPQNRPTAVKGDVIVGNLTIQGVDTAAQTVNFYLVYRERTT